MAHDIERLLRAAAGGFWFIDPRKAQEILAVVALRVAHGPRAEPAFPDRKPVALSDSTTVGQKVVRVIRLQGTIMPRGNMMSDMSGAVSLDRFGTAFDQAAADQNTGAIVLDIDSPGGNVAMVPETVAKIRAAKRADRPIIAVANTMAASAAYWIACACDEIVVSPSAEVGSIGVYAAHQDMSVMLEAAGIKTTMIFEGPRKIEGNPYQPLDEAAIRAYQTDCRYFYDLFCKDVAKGRGVAVSVVQADPEAGAAHMGGGRCYPAAEAVRLGMADRIGTFDDTVARVSRPLRARQRAEIARQKLALI